MSKAILVIGVVIIAVLGIRFFTADDSPASDDAMKKDEGAMMEQKDASKTEDKMIPQENGAMMTKGGQYVTYDASKIAFAKEGKVVLFFRASWCPSCRALDSDIKANLSQIPGNVLILDVDYDKSADLKREYGVTSQHTLVQVDENGKMITKWSGSPELGDLLRQLK